MELNTKALVLGFRAFQRGWEKEARLQIKRAIRKGKTEYSKVLFSDSSKNSKDTLRRFTTTTNR
jgi:hypothetical protein